jgi:hypothetical protein
MQVDDMLVATTTTCWFAVTSYRVMAPAGSVREQGPSTSQRRQTKSHHRQFLVEKAEDLLPNQLLGPVADVWL